MRRHAEVRTEPPAEVSTARETDVERDLNHRLRRSFDQKCRFFHADFLVGRRRRKPGLAVENPFKLASGDADMIGDLFDLPPVVDVFLHAKERCPDATVAVNWQRDGRATLQIRPLSPAL